MDTIRILFPVFLLPILVAAAVAVPVAFRGRSRAGWLGAPVAALVVMALWGAGTDETLALAVGAAIAGGSAGLLPRFDRWAAVATGILATWLFIWIVPQGGPDSPLNLIVAVCTLAFAIGALSGLLLVAGRAALRSRSGPS
jgi:hypothetical protein